MHDMKKLTLLLGTALVLGTAVYAGDGHKEGCCKGKKEACAKEKKEACAKGKGCCKKGEGKTATANDVKKSPAKENKGAENVKKS